MKRLLFVRHGETDWNLEVRLQGQLDVDLNDTGRNEAILTGRWIKKLRDEAALDDASWGRVRVAASDSVRTMETARLICEQLGLDVAQVTRSELLRERACGKYEGETWSKLAAGVAPEVYAALPEPKFVTVLDHILHEAQTGESKEVYLERVLKCCQWLLEVCSENDSDAETFIIVSHGLTLRVIIALLFFRSMTLEAFQWPQIDFRNCSTSEARLHHGRLSLISLNQVGHLPQKDKVDRYNQIAKLVADPGRTTL